MSRWEKYGSSSNLTQFSVYLLQSIFTSSNLLYKILAITESLEFKIWKKRYFGKIITYYSRHKLCLAILDELNNSKVIGSKVNIYEFGVAFGELTNYIIENTKFLYNYNGFDTFTGLPDSWRGLPKGALSTSGKLPDITGDNIFFHVGLVEDTISSVDFKSENVNFFIFDLDLYAPTLFTYKFIRKNIKKDDILLFDQAFTSDERIIIKNYFFRDFNYKVIGSTPLAIAFKIEEVLF